MDECVEAERERTANIVVGQNVEECKIVLAQQMRREMTPFEAKLWERLRRSNLGVKFRRQQIIAGFIADFYCHPASLVVEIDGPIHDAGYDSERDRIFASHNIATLRFSNRQVEEQVGVVLYQIRQRVKARVAVD
jgi:very-short-patch-repair endonuclease